MDRDVQFTDITTLVVERTLPGPIERVWAYLTDSDKRARWLAGGPMGQFVGGSVALHFRHMDLSDDKTPAPDKYARGEKEENNHIVAGTVTRFEPPNVLAYTWGQKNSEVTFELTTQGSQVHLLLTHRDLTPDIDNRTSVASGWHAHLATLIEELSDSPRSAFWPRHATLEAHYRAVLRTEGIADE